MLITAERHAQLTDARNWRGLDMDSRDGMPVATRLAGGLRIGKRFVGAKAQGSRPTARGRAFDFERRAFGSPVRIEWSDADDLAAFETTPGELRHLAEHGVSYGGITLDGPIGNPRFEYEMEFPRGTHLAWQPPIVEADRDPLTGELPNRPAAVVGSYAVFAPDGTKHSVLMRPVARSAHGDIVWGTIEATRIRREPATDVYRVVVLFAPGDLNRLAYPVSIDGNATTGHSSIGGTSTSHTGNYQYTGCGYPGAAGTVTAAYAYVNLAGGNTLAIGLYDMAGNLLQNTGAISGTGSAAWLNGSLDSSQAIVGGVQYLGGEACGTARTGYYDTTQFYEYGYHAYTYSSGNTQDPLGSIVDYADRRQSLYFVYTASGGGGGMIVHPGMAGGMRG